MPTAEEFVTALRESALSYINGSLPVFPLHSPKKKGLCDCPDGEGCSSPAKHPRTIHGFKDASREEEKVTRWWTMWPRANVGIAVPSGYVVLDVDGEAGQQALTDNNFIIPATPAVTTGRGWHYWFKTSRDLAPKANLLPKVDTRGPGGYVVAPPSLHVTGRQYQWLPGHNITDLNIAPAPSWLYELVEKQSDEQIRSQMEDSPVNLEALLKGVPEGRRDVEIFRAACKARAAGLPVDFTLAMVRHIAVNCDPPFDREVAERKVMAAYQKYPEGRGITELPADITMLGHDAVMIEFEQARFVYSSLEKSNGSLLTEMEVTCLMPGTVQEPYVQHLNLLSMSTRDMCRRELDNIFGKTEVKWAALLSRSAYKAQDAFLKVDRSLSMQQLPKPGPLGFLIDGYLPDQGVAVLFGAGSSTKTYIAMDQMICVSLGEPWLGRKTRQANGLFIDYETGDTTWSFRMKRLCDSRGIDHHDLPIRYWPADGVPFHDQADAIRRCCDEHDIGFVALDHIAIACGANPLDPEAATRFYRAVSRIGRPLLAIAHITGAAEVNPELAARPFGTVYWSNGARRTYFILRHQENESRVAELGIYAKKVNDGAKPADFGARVEFSDPDGPIRITQAGLMNAPTELVRARGDEFVVYEVLDHPMTEAEIALATGYGPKRCYHLLRNHPNMFRMQPTTGSKTVWVRATEDYVPSADEADDQMDLSDDVAPWDEEE